MVTLTKIYTRGGDKGETSLGDGSRVAKHDLRVDAYGCVDETNATIGLARLHTEGEIDLMLERIQNDLFDLGADLCTPEEGRRAEGALRIVAEQVNRLEAEIDSMNGELSDLTSFILPGEALLPLICICVAQYAVARNGCVPNWQGAMTLIRCVCST